MNDQHKLATLVTKLHEAANLADQCARSALGQSLRQYASKLPAAAPDETEPEGDHSISMKIDLAGVLLNAADELQDIPRNFETRIQTYTKNATAFTLRHAAKHIYMVRGGDDPTTVVQFRNLYGLNPGDMIHGTLTDMLAHIDARQKKADRGAAANAAAESAG